jgi:hypothetical protein
LEREQVCIQVQLEGRHLGPIALALARLAKGQVEVLKADDLRIQVAVGLHGQNFKNRSALRAE